MALTDRDRAEVANFAAFLHALADAEIPPRWQDRTEDQTKTFQQIYARHYPEDAAAAEAEARAHLQTIRKGITAP